MGIKGNLRLWRAITLAVATASPSVAVAEARAEFDCRIVDEAIPDGKSIRNEVGFAVFQQNKLIDLDHFTFSEKTGEFRWPSLKISIKYNIRQYGSTVNSIVAVAAVQGPASYSLKTLQISTFDPVGQGNDRLYPFLLLDENHVATGFCRMT